MFKQITSKQTWLVLPADDGTRQDTLSSTSMSQKEIEEYTKKGYFNVDYETFNKLLGNRGEIHLIDKQGRVYPKPPYVPTLEELKAAKMAEIKSAYVKNLEAVVWVEHTDGNTYGYDTDKISQVDFNSSYQRSMVSGTTRYNVYTNNSDLKQKEFVVHNPDMFRLVLEKAGLYQESVYAHYYETKMLVENAESKEVLDTIKW